MWGFCDELVMQGFFNIVVQLEIPVVFAVETDGISNLFHGVHGTMDRRGWGVDGIDRN